MIIHAGDVSNKGTRRGVLEFLDWFQGLDFEHKIFIAGNHDFFFEQAVDIEIEDLIPDNVIYLNDSGIEINDLKFWGSPIQPWFHDWAFNRRRGVDIKKHWDLIPEDTDVLITHGPPMDILDRTVGGQYVGCEDLKNRIAIVKPKIHVFGHIHEAYGIRELRGTKFINASVLNFRYQMVNAPVEIVL
jgi:Icc-related predicted phosphoesterase